MNMTESKLFFVELHPRDQSVLNHHFTFDKIKSWMVENMYYNTYFTPTMIKRLKKRRHDCDEENSMKRNQCFDSFYMSKMNCSFPWLKNYQGPLERCGSGKHVDELTQLMKNVEEPKSELSEELTKFGCSTPNCWHTLWKICTKIF